MVEDIKQMSVTRQQICRDQLRTRTFMFYLIKTTLNENEWKSELMTVAVYSAYH